MFTLHKIKNLLTYTITCLLITCATINEVYATCGSPGSKCPEKFRTYQSRNKAQAPGAPQEVTQAYDKMQALQTQIEALCEKGDAQISYLFCITSEELIEGMQKAGVYEQYQSLVNEYHTLDSSIIDYQIDEKNACGPNFPWGCPEGQKCVQTRSDNSRARGGMNATYINDTSTTYSCMDEVPEDRNSMVAGQHKYSEVQAGAANTVNEYHTEALAVSNDATVNANGDIHHETSIAGATIYEYSSADADDMYSRKNNKSCNIPALKEQYLSTCYSCTIVAQMLQVFLKAASQAYSVTREAGIKLLTIGMFIWIAIYILKQISQFVQPEPMKMLQELFTFFFKCFVAYVAITSGITILTQMIINPILAVGAEFGTAVISAVGDFKFSPATGYVLDASAASVLDQNTFQKMMGLSKAADNAVSINFVIGNAVTCHSTHAGAIFFAQKITDKIGIELFFPDVWLWLCGIIIWVFAFMLVIGVNFYLLDIGFKIGFVVLLLPVALGLWPFAAPFKNVFSALFKQIVNAAGIFVFLGVTTSMSMALISGALGNADKLLANISAAGSTTDEALEAQRLAEISDVFGLWSGAFILIIFAYLYSYKLISETVDKMANKFFPGDMTGNSIHTMTVQAMDWCKDKVMAVAGLVAGAVTGGASSVAQTAGKAAVKTAVKTAASTARGVGRGIGSVARKFKRGSGSNSN